MCVYFVANMCAGRFGLGWAHDVFTIAYHMLMCFHAYVRYILYILIYWTVLRHFWLSLSPSLSLSFFRLVASWHLNVNLLHPRTLFVPGHPLLLTLLPHTSGSVMIKLDRIFRRTFLDKAFIRNAKSSCRISPTLTFPLSFTVGNGSHCVTSWSHVHLMMRMLEMLALPSLMRCLLDTLTLCHSWKKNGVVLVMKVLIVRGRVSLGDFC